MSNVEPTADSIRARLTEESRAAIDRKLSEWFEREQDAHNADELLNLGHD